MSETTNTALWDTLRVIDRKATKPFQKTGGFRGTQIDPCWRIQRMTEVFGPVGQGWGWEQVGIHFADGLVFVCVRVWYVPAGEAPVWPAVNGAPSNARWTGPQWGGDVLTLKRGQNSFPNDEAPKMAMTDALGKALLSIGLAADVYMGLFDDSKYRDLTEREEDQRQQQQKAEPTKPATDPAAFWKGFYADRENYSLQRASREGDSYSAEKFSKVIAAAIEHVEGTFALNKLKADNAALIDGNPAAATIHAAIKAKMEALELSEQRMAGD